MSLKPAIIQSNLLLQFKELTHGLSTKLGGFDQPPYFNNLSYRVGDDEYTVTASTFIFCPDNR